MVGEGDKGRDTYVTGRKATDPESGVAGEIPGLGPWQAS